MKKSRIRVLIIDKLDRGMGSVGWDQAYFLNEVMKEQEVVV